ncbi:MAG: nucleotidyltransferase family protein [Firmicutes bacterium]|nr:nucleotidyltransferase family protein [Bacillota bacterium]
MRLIFIIAEYDPFHNGHSCLVSRAKEQAPDAVVAAIMSGNFTERGTPALTDRFTRAKAALDSGVNLVLSLPFPWCASSSEYFAAAGVSIANALLAAYPTEEHILAFGSECGDIDKIKTVARRLASDNLTSLVKSGGHEYHAARGRAAAYRELYGDDGTELLSSPNDTLAAEYVKAIDTTSSPLTPYAVKRRGARHDSDDADSNIASASLLRRLITEGRLDEAARFMPKASSDAIFEFAERYGVTYPERAGDAMLFSLRMREEAEAEKYAECAGGVGRRIISSARAAGSYEEMLELSATKQYTNSRIRRSALFCALGVEPFRGKLPTYTRLLAADEAGIAALHGMTRNSPIEILT